MGGKTKKGTGSQATAMAKVGDAKARMEEYLKAARDHLEQAIEIADEYGFIFGIERVLGESIYPNVSYFGKCPFPREKIDEYGYAPDGSLWVDAEDAWYDDDSGKLRDEAKLRDCEWVSSSRNCA